MRYRRFGSVWAMAEQKYRSAMGKVFAMPQVNGRSSLVK